MGQPKFRRVKQCIFCPRKADSKEHAWSDWLLRRFGKDGIVIVGGIAGQEYYDPNQKQIRVKCVCESCNTGWMKELEDTVNPIITPIIFERTQNNTTLDVLQQWAIAQWAVKTTMVWEYCQRKREPFFSRPECVALRNATTPALPSYTHAWLGAYDGRDHFSTEAGYLLSDPAHGLEGHIATYVFWRLVIQVITIRSDSKTDPYTFIDCNQRLWSDALVRIWPTTGVVTWPPPLWLKDDLHLDALHARCGQKQGLGARRQTPLKADRPYSQPNASGASA